MGCAASAKEDQYGIRKRLTVGYVDPDVADSIGTGDVDEQERGLMTRLNNESLLDLLERADNVGKKVSIGSKTDESRVSFSNKSTNLMGDELDPAVMNMGYTCRKGLKPESPNQDSWFCVRVENNFSMYAVFDGHGLEGHSVSNYVKDTLPKIILGDPRFTSNISQVLKDAFVKMQSLVVQADAAKVFEAQMSGTTATVAVYNANSNLLTVGHVADSTAVLGSKKDGKWGGIALTRDHKPNLKDEKARITKAGGQVIFDGHVNHRVFAKNGKYPGLNMSRCLGDLLGHRDCGITAEPEVSQRTLQESDQVLLVCSDGVWEFIQPQQAVDIVVAYAPEKAMHAAEKLAKKAWDLWIKEEGGSVVDDITVVLTWFK
mmetsp:Transcript_17243/g.30238  ORF Transcript_17243/g.30238 Transcript_17243/m.30238 type:complete len:374 (+) Transcript_17243:83-1204(+)